MGAECSYLIAPKPLGRRPRKPRSAKEPDSQGQYVSFESPAQPVLVDASPGASLEYVASGDTPENTLPQCLPQDSPGLSNFPQDLPSQQFDMGLTTPGDWSYPPLSLYSPSMDGGLPFDVSLGTLTPGTEVQQYFPLNVTSVADSALPPLVEKAGSGLDWKLPTSTFIPYVNLFFERLYPVFPILDRDSLPSEETLSDPNHSTWDRYALHTSLAAAVTVQLNIVGSSTTASTGQQPWSDLGYSSIDKSGNFCSADFWIHQALQARSQWDFMSNPSEATIMTSFFLFEYYGNKNQSQRAWYYLREAIGFALAIGLDDQDTYENLDPKVAQRLCRLFWLLFITERYVFTDMADSD